MDIKFKTIADYKELLNEEKTQEQQLLDKVVHLATLTNKELNLFETIIDDFSKEKGESLISGVPYVLNDNISTKDILSTGSSEMLKNYIPVYDATVYRKLKEAGAVLVGKTVIDELGLGLCGTKGHLGPVVNPIDATRVVGGSSSGSAVAVASGIVPFAIGSDTDGGVRRPAAYNGIVGFKPTYGRISRYGLFALASSLDSVGIYTNCVKDVAILTDVLKGKDSYDMTTLDDESISYVENLNNNVVGKKLFYFKHIIDSKYYGDCSDSELVESLKLFEKTIKKLEQMGFVVEGVDFNDELLKLISSTQKIISYAEATSNNANLTGIQFGYRGIGENIEEIITNARTHCFSNEVKKSFVMGAYFLKKDNQEKIFLSAQKVRRLIVNKMNELFDKYDALICPGASSIAPKIKTSCDEPFVIDSLLSIANLGGNPSITIPSGIVNKMPVGINITGKAHKDCELLNIANKIEQSLNDKTLKMDGE